MQAVSVIEVQVSNWSLYTGGYYKLMAPAQVSFAVMATSPNPLHQAQFTVTLTTQPGLSVTAHTADVRQQGFLYTQTNSPSNRETLVVGYKKN